MRLVSYSIAGAASLGVLTPDGVLDAAALLDLDVRWKDLQQALEERPGVIEELRSALRRPLPAAIAKAAFSLNPPLLRPPTIRDFMAYEGHATMGGAWSLSEAWYRLPIFYFSNPLCVFGPDARLAVPSASHKLDYELEIAAVIAREGRNVRREDAASYIAGFTIFVDWSARDLQRDEMQASLGPAKGKDFANSIGPAIVTSDELQPLWRDGQLHGRCVARVNGEVWTDSIVEGMHHDWAALIERASRDSRIVPGDVIGSGCVVGGSIPEALRLGKPARYLRPGDRVEIEVEGLGMLATTLGEAELSSEGYPYTAPSRAK